MLKNEPVFCEVKTINVSADEADRRRRIAKGDIFATSVNLHVDDGFLKKLTATLEQAVGQLDGADPERGFAGSVRIGFAMVDRLQVCCASTSLVLDGTRSPSHATGATQLRGHDDQVKQGEQEVLHARDSVGQTSGATQRCLNPGFSERIGDSRRTGPNSPDRR